MTLFGNTVFAGVIKDRDEIMVNYWALNPMSTLIKYREGHTEGARKGGCGHEAEMGALRLQAKACWQPPAAGHRRASASPSEPQKESNPLTPGFLAS